MSQQANQSSNYRTRLAQLRARRQSGGTSNLDEGLFTPKRGGFDRQLSIQPVVYGEELALVNDASMLCLGKIGSSGNVCLKRKATCDTDTHSKKKGTLPDGMSLILLKGDEKGYENVTLDVNNLDKKLIDELLSRKNVSWPSEFAKIESNDTKTVSDWEIVENVLNTTRKHRTFSTPGKKLASEDVLDKIAVLNTSQRLLSEILELDFDKDSGEAPGKDFSFEESSYLKVCTDVYDRVDVLAENSKCLNDVVNNLQPFIESQTKPLENIVSGLRTEMASLQGQVGKKDLLRKDVPPCIWSAVETGFDSLLEVGTKLDKITDIATEAHEVAGALLSAEEEKDTTNQSPTSVLKMNQENFFDNLNHTTIVDGKIIRPTKSSPSHDPSSQSSDRMNNTQGPNGNGDDPNRDGFVNVNHVNCDKDELLCARCMVKFNELESKLINTNIRVSNLEDSKSGNVETAIMVKNKVYRGRGDIAAELATWFPAGTKNKIDAGLFPTPHLILNLTHADICSKRGPKISLDQRDLIKLGIRRSDADAFFALQSDKPEFMISNDLCPNFSYKATKAQKESASIRFIPSHEDFGNGLDTSSLHFKFKQSLEFVRSERERYIESKLQDHPDPRVLAVSKQLLDDSCKFVTQMLGFMDETYAACYESFGATSEAWELVSHCVEEIFTKEFKPCLQFCVAQDLVEVEDALIGVIHSAFSLNCKVRELTSVSLKNHHSTTTSHVRFVMKMAKTSRKGEAKSVPAVDKAPATDTKLKATIANLEKDNSDLKLHVKRVESRLDSLKSQIKNYLGLSEEDLSKSKKKYVPPAGKVGGGASTDKKE
jgi:hypothetical protein